MAISLGVYPIFRHTQLDLQFFQGLSRDSRDSRDSKKPAAPWSLHRDHPEMNSSRTFSSKTSGKRLHN